MEWDKKWRCSLCCRTLTAMTLAVITVNSLTCWISIWERERESLTLCFIWQIMVAFNTVAPVPFHELRVFSIQNLQVLWTRDWLITTEEFPISLQWLIRAHNIILNPKTFRRHRQQKKNQKQRGLNRIARFDLRISTNFCSQTIFRYSICHLLCDFPRRIRCNCVCWECCSSSIFDRCWSEFQHNSIKK